MTDEELRKNLVFNKKYVPESQQKHFMMIYQSLLCQ